MTKNVILFFDNVIFQKFQMSGMVNVCVRLSTTLRPKEAQVLRDRALMS